MTVPAFLTYCTFCGAQVPVVDSEVVMLLLLFVEIDDGGIAGSTRRNEQFFASVIYTPASHFHPEKETEREREQESHC